MRRKASWPISNSRTTYAKFQRAYDQKTKDPFDLYLELKEREEGRRKKGLPPRAILNAFWVGLTRLDEVQRHLVLIRPLIHDAARELSSVVYLNRRGGAGPRRP